MALEIKLNQKLSQSLVMTPQLQQAIKLLQLGRAEYLEVIDRELQENPVLEDAREDEVMPRSRDSVSRISEAGPLEGRNGSGEESAYSTNSSTAFEEGGFTSETPQETIESSQIQVEADLVSYFDLYADAQGTSYSGGRRSTDDGDDLPPIEATVSKREGLASHLTWQLRTSNATAEEQEVAAHIIGNLDRNGYLELSVEEIAQECGSEISVVEGVLEMIQQFDPVGIAARDLRECLLIQLNQLGMDEMLPARIVERHLEKLETRRYEAIARDERVTVEEVYEALKQIQRLEPRPGRPFVDEEPIYITPDLYIKKLNGEWVVSLNEAGMPKLRLNNRYRELLRAVEQTAPSEREYLQDRVRSAAWLIKSVVQRQRTIHRVAESIMQFQRDFLDQGVSALRPLVLRDVAQDVSMHESTISRVTTNKFIHTPHGVFELKYFFSSGLRSLEGDISSESVKERIRDMIADEDSKNPLSDQQLAERLKADGIDIARRTVAKYREMLQILSSSRRKKPF